MKDSRLRTLLLYADYTTRLSYYDDWIDAFTKAPQFAVSSLNLCQRGIAGALKAELREADLVVLLHSTNGDTTAYLEPFAAMLADRRGLLLAFVGNEVNLPGSPIAGKRAVLSKIGPDFVATQLPQEAGDHLWGDLVRRRVLEVPHALNTEAFRPDVPDERRPIDIGVRAVRYLPHLGDRDRNRLHDIFSERTFSPPLAVDIGTERLNREGWAGFLNRCKGTISTEAGSWWVERDDGIMNENRLWTAERVRGKGLMIANDSPLRTLGHKLPWWLRAALRKLLSRGLLRHESTVNEEIPFDEVYDRFFKGRARPEVYCKCVSSRHFDAIGTRTCQILVKGRYNGTLEPGKHYIELAEDFSNLDEAVERFRDPEIRQRITAEAYEHARTRHSFSQRLQAIAAAVHDTE